MQPSKKHTNQSMGKWTLSREICHFNTLIYRIRAKELKIIHFTLEKSKTVRALCVAHHLCIKIHKTCLKTVILVTYQSNITRPYQLNGISKKRNRHNLIRAMKHGTTPKKSCHQTHLSLSQWQIWITKRTTSLKYLCWYMKVLLRNKNQSQIDQVWKSAR